MSCCSVIFSVNKHRTYLGGLELGAFSSSTIHRRGAPTLCYFRFITCCMIKCKTTHAHIHVFTPTRKCYFLKKKNCLTCDSHGTNNFLYHEDHLLKTIYINSVLKKKVTVNNLFCF